ncbi:GDSL-type esterase/lipase family protein [Aeromicrobium sp. NPDC092404]|uniref:GDSL-type esterase/lipase family protein n=1 Tax=Aeromicrobium sp. NPDC092404 TaxID=3154976 RepID=UPI003441E2B2
MRPLCLLLAALLAAAVLASPAHAATPKVTIGVSSKAPVYGNGVTVSGRVTSVPRGTKVVLQRNLGAGWLSYRSLTTSSTGRYSTSYVATLGQNHLRLVVPAKGSRRKAVSPQLVVSAKLRVTPHPAYTDQPVDLVGRLRTFVARPVEVQVTRGGVVTTVTGRTGSTGVFTIRTSLAGPATVKVVAPQVKIGSKTYVAFTMWSQAVNVVDRPFAASAAPTISGTPRFGEVLTRGQVPWDPSAEMAYQWTRGGSPIAGATGTTYTVAVADVGQDLRVIATGTRAGYATTTRTSAAVRAAAGQLVAPAPTVGGVLAPDEVAHADPGGWTPGTSFAYAWAADGVPIPGATGPDHTISAEEIGSRLSVKVTGSKQGFETVSRTSAPSAPVAQGVLRQTEKPVVVGDAQVGSALTAATGTWDPGVTLACQWLRSGVAISGATTCRHEVTNVDAGSRLAVRVTGTKAGWAPATWTSEETAVVTGGSLASTPVPTISGTPVVGGHLLAATGSWDDGVALAYQWRRAGAAIPGATAPIYDPTDADAGSRLSVTVTGTKPGFTATARTSAVTAPVALGALTSDEPVVSGVAEPGETFFVTPGSWGPAPVRQAYRWIRDDVAIPGATSSTYTLTEADRGSLLAVKVTGAKDGYAEVTRTSNLRAVPGPQSPSKLARALRTYHAATDKVGQEPLDVFVGPSDSIADGARASAIQKRWISVFRDDLRAAHQPAGVPGGFGYLDPFNWEQFPDDPMSYEKGVGVFEQGLGRQTLALFDSTQTVTVRDTLPFTDLDIIYSGRSGSAGAFTYSVDGGPAVRVETGGKATTRGGYAVQVSGLSAGRHQVVLRGAGGGTGNPAIIEGVMLYNGDRDRGVRVWEGGASARRAIDYVAPDDGWATSLRQVHPDLVVLPIGSNDFALGISAADTETRIREIIAMIRSHVDTDPSIVLMSYYDRPTGGTGTWAAYEEMYARIAATDPDIAVFDISDLFGAYGSTQRKGLMAADQIHPSDAGYALIAHELAELVSR